MFNRKDYKKKWREKNKHHLKVYNRKWRDEHKDELKVYMRKWRDEHKDVCRQYSRRLWRRTWLAKFGLTEQQYAQMCAKQKNRCAICKKHKTKVVRGLHIDHDHKTGTIRGLLCMNCNTAIGKLNDSPTLIKRVLKYLQHK